MKKIFKVFSLLLAFATLMTLTSCDDLWGLINENDKPQSSQQDNTTDDGTPKDYVAVTGVINHDFYLSDDKGSYIYYTSINSFQYGNYTDCVYQISFTPKDSAATRGDWKLYTRPRGSNKTIDFIYKGTFEGVNGGSIKTGGTVKLLIGSELVDTLTIAKSNIKVLSGEIREKYVFNANVSAAHAAIDAHDEK